MSLHCFACLYECVFYMNIALIRKHFHAFILTDNDHISAHVYNCDIYVSTLLSGRDHAYFRHTLIMTGPHFYLTLLTCQL